MKYRSMFLLLVLTNTCVSQVRIQFNKLSFNNLHFSTPKDSVLKVFGAPDSIVYPDYECGFYANDQPGSPYYQLHYKNLNYIGSDKENFKLENVYFDSLGVINIKYKNIILSGKTTKAEFAAALGTKSSSLFDLYTDPDAITILSANSDDGITFYFKANKLIRLEYWSPC